MVGGLKTPTHHESFCFKIRQDGLSIHVGEQRSRIARRVIWRKAWRRTWLHEMWHIVVQESFRKQRPVAQGGPWDNSARERLYQKGEGGNLSAQLLGRWCRLSCRKLPLPAGSPGRWALLKALVSGAASSRNVKVHDGKERKKYELTDGVQISI